MSQIRTNSIVPAGGIPAGASGGGIIQCVSTTKTDTFTSSSTSWVDITGLSVSITPRSSSNKILVNFNVSGWIQWDGHVRLDRNGTTIAIGDAAGSRQRGTFEFPQTNRNNEQSTNSMYFLDSPGSTSSLTYKVQCQSTDSQLLFVNRTESDADNLYDSRTISTIIVMEVSG